MSSDFTFVTLYEELMESGKVRKLLKEVVQDAQQETIDLIETAKHFRSIAAACEDFGGEVNEPRLKIISFLNKVHAIMYSLSETSLYENHTRLRKIIAASVALESLNLRLVLGATPTADDIPQAHVYITVFLDQFDAAKAKERFVRAREKCPKIVEAYTIHAVRE